MKPTDVTEQERSQLASDPAPDTKLTTEDLKNTIDLSQEEHLYRKLFLATFTLSAFTFGGGYVIVSLMRSKFVNDLRWIKEEEMLNITAIGQSSPGPVAINTSILLGYEVGGVRGALTAIFGTVLPPFIIISIISFFYDAFRTNRIVNSVLNGMNAGVAAVIMDVVLGLAGNVVKTRDWVNIVLMALAFIATYFWGVNVAFIILGCGIIGALRSVMKRPAAEAGTEGLD